MKADQPIRIPTVIASRFLINSWTAYWSSASFFSVSAKDFRTKIRAIVEKERVSLFRGWSLQPIRAVLADCRRWIWHHGPIRRTSTALRDLLVGLRSLSFSKIKERSLGEMKGRGIQRTLICSASNSLALRTSTVFSSRSWTIFCSCVALRKNWTEIILRLKTIPVEDNGHQHLRCISLWYFWCWESFSPRLDWAYTSDCPLECWSGPLCYRWCLFFPIQSFLDDRWTRTARSSLRKCSWSRRTCFILHQVMAYTFDGNLPYNDDTSTETFSIDRFETLIAENNGDFRMTTENKWASIDDEQVGFNAYLLPCWMKRLIFEQRLVLVARPPSVRVIAFIIADFPPRETIRFEDNDHWRLWISAHCRYCQWPYSDSRWNRIRGTCDTWNSSHWFEEWSRRFYEATRDEAILWSSTIRQELTSGILRNAWDEYVSSIGLFSSSSSLSCWTVDSVFFCLLRGIAATVPEVDEPRLGIVPVQCIDDRLFSKTICLCDLNANADEIIRFSVAVAIAARQIFIVKIIDPQLNTKQRQRFSVHRLFVR